MSESSPPPARHSTACPSCRGELRWYHLLLGSIGRVTTALTCPGCGAGLRLGPLPDLLMGLLQFAGFWAGLALALIALIGRGGVVMPFAWAALCLTGAGLLMGLVRLSYVLNGKALVAKPPGRRERSPARRLSFVTGTLGSLAVASAALTGFLFLLQWWVLRQNQPELPSGSDLRVLGQADAGWTLETLDGREVPFGSFEGRAVFLNVWATWCPPCVGEIPGIQDLYDAVKDEGVAVVLVTDEPAEVVRPFVEGKGWHVPVYLARDGVPAVFRTDAIPATFVVSRRGEVVFRHTGSADWNTADCRDLLLRLQRGE